MSIRKLELLLSHPPTWYSWTAAVHEDRKQELEKRYQHQMQDLSADRQNQLDMAYDALVEDGTVERGELAPWLTPLDTENNNK